MTALRYAPPRRYRLLIRLATPLLWLWVAIVALRQTPPGADRRRFIQQRLGLWRQPRRDEPEPLWIHAASVGEVLTAAPLLAEIGSQPVLVTTATTTGAAVLAQRFPELPHRYLPLDWPGAVSQFFSEVQPRAIWFIETEIWPWIYAIARERKVPVHIVNARLSARTLNGAARGMAPVYAHALQSVTVLARSQEDATRFRQLGADSVQLTGDLKLAGAAHTLAANNMIDSPFSRPFHLCASTHDDEEVQLARAWCEADTDALLVIAPRHPERGVALAEELAAIAGHPVLRRAAGERPAAQHRLYLADTLGEMQVWYAGADSVFVGGSLIARGGHNLLEPAGFGRAICSGHHTDNFREAEAMLIAANALFQSNEAAEIVAWMLNTAPAERNAMGTRASNAVASRGRQVLQDYVMALGLAD